MLGHDKQTIAIAKDKAAVQPLKDGWHTIIPILNTSCGRTKPYLTVSHARLAGATLWVQSGERLLVLTGLICLPYCCWRCVKPLRYTRVNLKSRVARMIYQDNIQKVHATLAPVIMQKKILHGVINHRAGPIQFSLLSLPNQACLCGNEISFSLVKPAYSKCCINLCV